MSSCLVVGGNGFLGSHVVDRLAEEGHEVTVFDRFSSSQRFESTDVRIVVGDFLNTQDLRDAVVGQQYVLHFLSMTTPLSAESDPTLDVRANVMQSLELLQACAAQRVERLVFASSGGAIYGEAGESLRSEEDIPLPTSPYAIGKLTIEHYLRYYRVTRGLESVSLRIANPYGPRQPASRRQGLIPIVLRRIALNEPVVQLGDGSTVRDYIFVTDVARRVASVVDRWPKYDVYNIGSGLGFSTAEILAEIGRVIGRKFEILRVEAPATFVPRVVLSTTRFDAEYGDLGLVALRSGIARTWESIRIEA